MEEKKIGFIGLGRMGGNMARVLETDAEDMIARDHECYFSAAHAAKTTPFPQAVRLKKFPAGS